MPRRTPGRRLLSPVVELLAAAMLLLAAGASRKSPFVEVVVEGRVAGSPRRTVHKNGRGFLEFEITLTEARHAPEQPPGADTRLAIQTPRPVKVVHDLSCGGEATRLSAGDLVEIRGEYVHVARGTDLIHFTHPAGEGCGRGSAHPGGYIRKLPARAAAPEKPPPASAVPDQPFTGPGPDAKKPYERIIAEKEAGKSDAELLAEIERRNERYSLTTAEIQKLRAAGLSETVITAMLRSGRAAAPTPTPR